MANWWAENAPKQTAPTKSSWWDDNAPTGAEVADLQRDEILKATGANATAHRHAAILNRMNAADNIPVPLDGIDPESGTAYINPNSPQTPALARLAVSPQLGVNEIEQGAVRMTHGLTDIAKRPGAVPVVGMYGVPVPMASPVNNDTAGGASQMLRGGMQAAAPLVLPQALIANPIGTTAGLALGMGGQAATEATARALGMGDGYANLLGDVTGLVTGGIADHYAPRMVSAGVDGLQNAIGREVSAGLDPSVLAQSPGTAPDPATNLRARVLGRALDSDLDPTEASAVQYGRDEGVHMRASTQTGSNVARNIETIVQHVPLAAKVAREAAKAEDTTLAAAGEREVSRLNPDNSGQAPEPLEVGDKFNQAALALEQEHSQRADDSYDLLRSIEAQPQHTATLQTGTRRVLDPATVDEAGNPAYKSVPVMEDIQAPVDRRAAKFALKPVLQRMLRLTPLAQEQSSVGIKALRNIVDGPDFESASITDEDLGAIKAIIRDSSDAKSVGLARLAVEQLSKAVDAAVERLGPDAVNALKTGREATIAKYNAQDLQAKLGFKNVGTVGVEPGSSVDLVNKITAPHDRNINLLRNVQQNMPEHLPALAQSVGQGLLDMASADAGMDRPKAALKRFNDLGAETQKILFGDRRQAWRDYLTLNKMMAENPNPSGTAKVLTTLKALGVVFTAPHIGIPMLFGSRAAARMLFNPETSRLMMLAMKTPADAPGAGLLARDLSRAMAKQGITPEPAPGGAAAGPAPANSGTPGAATQQVVAAKRPRVTSIEIPGQPGAGYDAEYGIGELDDYHASHNGLTFQPNPKAKLDNTRRYQDAENQGKLVDWSGPNFNPQYVTQPSVDALNGPTVVIKDPGGDLDNQVVAGHGRKEIQERVWAGNPKGAQALRDSIFNEASRIEGLDPSLAYSLKKPFLYRAIKKADFDARGPQAIQNFIRDTNISGTAAMKGSEQAIADSRRVSTGTLEDIAGRLESAGADATMGDLLKGKSGGEILARLVKDGVVSPQEQAAFVNNGELTPAGKERINKLMLGRFFRDPDQLEGIAPSVRNKVERIAAPLAQLEGRGEWDLSPDVQKALDILHQSETVGPKNIDDFIRQEGLFGRDKYGDRAITLAKALKGMKPTELQRALRQYAEDSNYAAGGNNMFGDTPTPESAFRDAFGSGTEPEPTPAGPKPKNSLGGGAAAKPKNALGN